MSELPAELIGAWRLTSLEDRVREHDEWHASMGKTPAGLLMCDASGAVSVQVYSSRSYPEHDYIGYFGIARVSGLMRGYDDVAGTLYIDLQGGYPPAVLDDRDGRPFHIREDVMVLGDRRTWQRTLVRIT
jgi:hypothetical protein